MSKTFGENLKSIRKERKLSQKKLAEMVEVSQQIISRWEKGMTEPTLGKLCWIADLFYLTVDELVGRGPYEIQGLDGVFHMNIKTLRERNHFPQSAFGAMNEVTQQCVSQWELQTRAPTLGCLVQIADMFELSIDELVGHVRRK